MAVANTVKETGNLLGWVALIVVFTGAAMWLILAAGGSVAGTAAVVRELWSLGWSLIGGLLGGADAPPVEG